MRRNAKFRSREHIKLNFGARKTTETKTAPRDSSFWKGKRSKLTAIAGLNPGVWESSRVLRPLWTELSA